MAKKKRKAPAVFSGLRHLMSPLVRRGELDGDECFIVPVVLMVEGVHNGKLYTNEFLSTLPEAWNGEPVVIWHPTLNGKPLSANTVEALTSMTVGRMFDCAFSNGRLRGNAYITDDKLESVKDGDTLHTMLQTNDPIEVSTGLFTEEREEAGEWNGEEYERVVVRGTPDHLAMLPGGQGACNWQDGAGAPRINEATRLDAEGIKKVEAALKKTATANEMSHDVIRDGLRTMLHSSLGITMESEFSAYVMDVFDGFFVYEHYRGIVDGLSLFKQSYAVTDESEISFVNEPTEVRIETSYTPVQNETTPPKASSKGHEGEEKTMTKNERINAIIANSGGKLGETERAHLDGMSEDQLGAIEKLSVNAEPGEGEEKPTTPVAAATVTPTVPAAAPGAVLETTPTANAAVDPEAFVASLPDSPLKELLTAGITQLEERKTGLITAIRANGANRFTEDWLKTQTVPVLEGIAGLAAKTDFSGRATGSHVTPSANAVEGSKPKGGGLEAPLLEFAKPEEKAS